MRSANMPPDEAAVLRNNPHMPQNDAAFCVWVLSQLHNSERYDMVEPFYILGDRLLDIRTAYQRLESGHYVDAAEFQRALFSIPTEYLEQYPGNHTLVHEKANNLLLTLLPERFAQRNRWEGNRRRSLQQRQQQQQQQAPLAPSTSASAAAVQAPPTATASVSAPDAAAASSVPSDIAAGAASGSAPGAHQQSRFGTPLVMRISATPKPSGAPPRLSAQGATGAQASDHGAPEHPVRPDPDDTSRRVSEAADLDSQRREARRGKKRAANDQGAGSSSKRARQEVEKHEYRYVLLLVLPRAKDTDKQQQTSHSDR